MPSEGGVLFAEGGRVPFQGVTLHLEGGMALCLRSAAFSIMMATSCFRRAAFYIRAARRLQRAATLRGRHQTFEGRRVVRRGRKSTF